ncbi:MAG: hypothetical protein GC191_14340 [Azospirillum sp.]|nr:hypothetical protein [Azospirillum sp.]
MSAIDFAAIRRGLASLDASAAHTASGENRPKVNEIFAPEPHAGALDPNVTIVLGARGAGKSFWAGVLGNDETRKAASEAYPHLGLDKAIVRFGFTGLENDGSVSRATIDHQVPNGQERSLGLLLWRCVVLRALQSALIPPVGNQTIGAMMKNYADPEQWEHDCAAADHILSTGGSKIVVVFDALDALAIEWERLRSLIDTLLEVAWATRGFRGFRLKLFLRPDQLRDLGLRFVELPKLLAGATNLRWTGTDLYGMLFARFGLIGEPEFKSAISNLLAEEDIAPQPSPFPRLRNWPLTHDRQVQARVFTRLAGTYMGRGDKKGKTYDWPLNHLADGHGEVTPRSFLTLMIQAARHPSHPTGQSLSAEGIRHGLREASRVRVDQLALEFPWIRRALAPLARMQVPCHSSGITERWAENKTIEAITRGAAERQYLPPFETGASEDPGQKLIGTLVRIGVLAVRKDGRYDMPDLFRVAARLLKKGGVAPA